MDKWADYLISEVSYDTQHLISIAIRHRDTDQGITKGKPIDRLAISSDIKNGISYVTIYSTKNSWKKGHKIQTFSINGEPFLRIDGNKVKLDYLGDLPNVSNLGLLEPELAPEPVVEQEKIPEPPPPSPRGSLPKESVEELPQELDLAPEPVVEQEKIPEIKEEEATPEQLARFEQLEKQIQELESRSKPEPEEEATPEQLARFEQLEKQIQELESQPPPPSPRGSLPKESTKEVFEEIEHATEAIYEPEEATPKQFAQLDELQKQIDELETKLSNKPIPKIKSEPKEEPESEQISEIDDLQDQIDELENELFSKSHPPSDEPTQEQISKVHELEKEIEKLESADIEHEIIQTLQKQNKKLDDIEKRLDSHSNKVSLNSNSLEAYCVKCRAKRKIKNPEETTMKNGRPAMKGFCSICNCKVFRIVKMKKS
nr:DUF5679 domain-containing protein [Nitrosopumilus sp. b2]